MSDPVKTEEIEDVLSSIRRLVSDEPGLRSPAPEPHRDSAQADKLVLTPAFRVAEDAAAPEQDVTPAAAEAPAEGEAGSPAPGSPETAAGERGPEAGLAEVEEVSWQEIPFRHRVAELEAAVAESDEDWEPDGSEIDVPGRALGRLEGEGAADQPDEGDPAGGDESLIDEESLRELVAEIVRQELQGTLGQRITRNVRKLVRQEINRALASRELG